MANLNRVTLIGRLTRDPEVKTFSSGGAVANVGFVVNNRRKNEAGEYKDVPVWIDLKAFNREKRKTADMFGAMVKGQQIYVEGHLVLEEWTGKEDGKKHTKMVVFVDDFQYLEKKASAELEKEAAEVPF